MPGGTEGVASKPGTKRASGWKAAARAGSDAVQVTLQSKPCARSSIGICRLRSLLSTCSARITFLLLGTPMPVAFTSTGGEYCVKWS